MNFLAVRAGALRQRIVTKFTLPSRLKGSIIEKWIAYWNGLARDYTEVAWGVVKGSYAKPKKALTYGVSFYALYHAAKRNPGEDEFLTILRGQTNRMIIVAPELQNPQTTEYLLQVERAMNQRKLRILSLGVCSLVWVDSFSDEDCTYPATCKYTAVSFWNFHKCVIDMGFWNEFWRLKWKMRNYDINYL